MYIKNLELKNIGPFKHAQLDFACDPNDPAQPPVTIITGINGAGKSIVIDALRTALSGDKIERDIVADSNDFEIKMTVDYGKGFKELKTNGMAQGRIMPADYSNIGCYLRMPYKTGDTINRWIIDYWSSRLPNDSFAINNMSRIDHNRVLTDVMSGRKSNVELTNFLCSIDYMRGSEVPAEKQTAETLFKVIREIINECLDNGEFKYIRRSDLTPIIEQNGHEVTLEKLSSGNIFMVEHLIMLICKMYSLSVLLNIKADKILDTPGLLLIDEIETHLHPRWQKSVLPIIRRTFPRLQIILTTHSPFVLSSQPGAKIYTCKPDTGCSIIEDETAMYGNMAIEEILLSDAFNVPPFNNEITEKIRERKQAVKEGRTADAKRIADELIEINDTRFMYLKVSRDSNTGRHETH